MHSIPCVLCGCDQFKFEQVQLSHYYRCQSCDLTFLDPKQRLSSDDEKARYEKHENNVLDQGYQNFVTPLLNQIIQTQSPDSKGLDYGSGPDSAISYLLRKNNYQIAQYDPYFFNQPAVLKESFYDYCIVCEVAEHFYNPNQEFKKIKSYLKPDGVLLMMTSLRTSQYDSLAEFAKWSYRRDATHVCFYSEKTCQYITQTFGFWSYNVLNPQLVQFSHI